MRRCLLVMTVALTLLAVPASWAVEHQPGEHQPGEHQPGEHQPGEHQPGEHRPAELSLACPGVTPDTDFIDLNPGSPGMGVGGPGC